MHFILLNTLSVIDGLIFDGFDYNLGREPYSQNNITDNNCMYYHVSGMDFSDKLLTRFETINFDFGQVHR